MSALAVTSLCPFDRTNSAIFSRADFDAIAEIVYGEFGNVYPEGKAMLVYSRLTKGCGSIAQPVLANISGSSQTTQPSGGSWSIF